jgi:tRNA (guanine37-N1)-methyltransferase
LNELPFYDEAHMKKNLRFLLGESLSSEELSIVFRSYDVVGDLAIIRIPQVLLPKRSVIAHAIMQGHNNVKTVLMQTGSVSGDFRIRRLEWVAGERKTLTAAKCEPCGSFWASCTGNWTQLVSSGS